MAAAGTVVKMADVAAHFHALQSGPLALALLAMLIGYIALVGYDWSALQYLGKRVPTLQVGLGGFLGYSIGNTIGLSVVSGRGRPLQGLFPLWPERGRRSEGCDLCGAVLRAGRDADRAGRAGHSARCDDGVHRLAGPDDPRGVRVGVGEMLAGGSRGRCRAIRPAGQSGAGLSFHRRQT